MVKNKVMINGVGVYAVMNLLLNARRFLLAEFGRGASFLYFLAYENRGLCICRKA
jgi:hypothetical protein